MGAWFAEKRTLIKSRETIPLNILTKSVNINGSPDLRLIQLDLRDQNFNGSGDMSNYQVINIQLFNPSS
jgi:hypothetical protein